MKDADLKISLENLQKLNDRIRRTEEMKLYDLSLVSESLAQAFFSYREDFDVLTSFSLLTENHAISRTHSDDDALPENGKLLRQKESFESLMEDVSLASFFMQSLENKKWFLTESDFFWQTVVNRKVSFASDALTEEAYEVFSEEYGEFTPLVFPSVKEAVKALEDGESGYCLLPFEEDEGNRFSHTQEWIEKYDLKIVAVTPVYGYDGAANMKYALLSDTLSVLPYSKEDDRYLELRLPEHDALFGLGAIVEYFGFSVLKIGKIPKSNENRYFAVVKSEGQSFLPLLVFYSLFSPDVSFVGIYKNLET